MCWTTKENAMKSSRFYQNYLQAISGISELGTYIGMYMLGAQNYKTATSLFIFRLISKFTISELMLRRLRAVVKEENQKKRKGNDNTSGIKED